MVSETKNPTFVEAGKRGAAQRWGGQRIVRLDSLAAPERDAIVALINAVKASKAKTPDDPGEAA